MSGYEFTGNDGSFRFKDADRCSYLYFPVASESGMMGAVTPGLGGDLKTSQNTFVLQPVSSEDLHNNRATRNFWLCFENGMLRSAAGNSVWQRGRDENAEVSCRPLTHRVTRNISDTDIVSEITTFVPTGTNDQIELTMFRLTNNGSSSVKFTPTYASPIYGRSATNIRDHRNVTSMLNRMTVSGYGVSNDPTLTFDERGHMRNKVVYGGFAAEGDGTAPVLMCPDVESYIGEGGTFDCPLFPGDGSSGVNEGYRIDGFEAMAAMTFAAKELAPGESAVYVTALALKEEADSADNEDDLLRHTNDLQDIALKYLREDIFESEREKQEKYWDDKNNIRIRTSDSAFDNWMYWVGIQPMLRRIYGCSFLPHHDYGKGGRGWRDLWQDCLALIIMDPKDVRGMLIDNFGGVRTDGTNATIIGSRRGEFIADRNGITRVWMDHAMWPFMTMDLYIRQSGDFGILLQDAPYFIDRQVMRGQSLMDEDSVRTSQHSEGSVLEHLLIQNLTAFFDVGEHGHMRLRGADWNDALDMGKDRGESVAFTAAYCGNYKKLASLIRRYSEAMDTDEIVAAAEIEELLGVPSVKDFGRVLEEYCERVMTGFGGAKMSFSVEEIADDLEKKAEWIRKHILETEWYTDSNGYARFNGYYDNNGRPLEKGDGKMMLTSQVFTVMSGIADENMVKEVARSADRYLYDASLGGYKLNTDFKEIKTDMGRMFGFSYGQKENGAVFSHMAVMFGNSLYSRGFAKEGWKAIGSLYRHAGDSRIYPGIPEYFDPRGRGVYHYLTGAASWLILTVLTEMFGVKGEYGDLKFEPKLTPGQFDNRGKASVSFVYNGRPVTVEYTAGKTNEVAKIISDGTVISEGRNVIPQDKIGSVIEVYLR